MTAQKETLQAKDIVGYIANGGLKAITVDTNRIVNFLIKDTELLCGANDIYKPLLNPLSHLTKDILFNGGTIVPLIECAKVAFPKYKGWGLNDNNTVSSLYSTSEFGFHNNSFYYIYEYYKFVPNQHALFQLLYQYKIDFLGLIDKGLAVDVSTMNVNPYL